MTDLDTRDLVAEIRHIGRTDSPENIAARLGFTVDGLSKRLYRDGFPELAAPFSAFRDRGHIPPRKQVTG